MPFSSLIGHRVVVDLLRRSVERGRVPQSVIFAGPDGVGKRTVALALAQAINCPKRSAGDACGSCGVCTRIARGQFSDVVYLDRGSEASIKIQAVRQRVLDAVGYRPFEGTRRVFIIDPADEMTEQAQDALLKTLEEPPASSMLILVTAYPDTLLATIRSRCRRVRFGSLAEDDVARVLVERLDMKRSDATARAAASGGSVARAMAIEEDEFNDDRSAALGLVSAAARSVSVSDLLKASAVFAKVSSKRRAREAAWARLDLVASIVRDVGAIGAGSAVPLANADLADELDRVARAFKPKRTVQAFGLVEEARQALGRNASPKLVADWLAVSL
jgi:DNA polymerase-3 subunit delta'